MGDLYEILEVSPRASQEVIAAAYRRLAQLYHPDLNKSPDAPARMKQINGAYEILNDPIRRSKYDQWRASRQNKPPRTEQKENTSKDSSPPPSATPPPKTKSAPPYKTPSTSPLKKKSVWGTIVTVITVLVAIARFGNLVKPPTTQTIASYQPTLATSTPDYSATVHYATQTAFPTDSPYPVGTPVSQRVQFVCNIVEAPLLTFSNNNFVATDLVYKNGDEVFVFGRIDYLYFVGVQNNQTPYYVKTAYICPLPKSLQEIPNPILNPTSTPKITVLQDSPTPKPAIHIPTPDPTNSLLDEQARLTPIAYQSVQICSGFAPIRISPSFDAREIGRAYKDSQFPIDGIRDGWLHGGGYGTSFIDGYINRSDLCYPNLNFLAQCNDFIFNRWKNGKSDQYAPPCTTQ